MPALARDAYRTKLIDNAVALMSLTYDPDVKSLCSCKGCSPFAFDDGRRPRTIVVKDNTSAFVGNVKRRQRQKAVWNPYESAEPSE